MPRPENPELRAKIVDCACELFRTRGYKATSYADLASAAGITKGLLQYHFPKKDQLATQVMIRVLEKAITALGIVEPAAAHSAEAYRDLYRIGQAYLAYLLASGGYKLFLRDIDSNLDLVDTVLAFTMNWALQYAQDSDRAADNAVLESVVMTMGGFYSLLHYNIAHGREMDVAQHLGTVMRKVMAALGFAKQEIAEALDDAELSAEEREQLVAAMKRA